MQPTTFGKSLLDSEFISSRAARQRAENALVEIALAAGDRASEFVIIGGLNPDFLTPTAPIAHLGTTDVDVLLELGVAIDREDLDFHWLEDAVSRAGAPEAAGWRFALGTGFDRVTVELICDVADSPGMRIPLPGASRLTANNFWGPSAALRNPVTRRLEVPERLRAQRPDFPADVSLQFANLGGYLITKAVAIGSRQTSKDSYDFMFVALFNGEGTTGACQAIIREIDEGAHPQFMSVVSAALLSYLDGERRSALAYAAGMLASGATEEREVLIEDAAAAAERMLHYLES